VVVRWQEGQRIVVYKGTDFQARRIYDRLTPKQDSSSLLQLLNYSNKVLLQNGNPAHLGEKNISRPATVGPAMA
jgi:hypothetical protein